MTVTNDIGFGPLKGPDGVYTGAGAGRGSQATPMLPPDTGAAPSEVEDSQVGFTYRISREGVASVEAEVAWIPPSTNVDGSPFTRLKHYRVSIRTAASPSPNGTHTYLADRFTTFTYERFNVIPGSTVEFRIVVVDDKDQESVPHFTGLFTAPEDDGPPPQPSTPVLSLRLGIPLAFWDGKSTLPDNGDGFPAGRLPNDFKYVEVHASTTSGFTPSAATLIDTLFGAGYASLDTFAIGTPVYVRFVAVDMIGQTSSVSAEATITPRALVDGDITIPEITFDALHPTLQDRLDADRQAAIQAGATAEEAEAAGTAAQLSANRKNTVYYKNGPITVPPAPRDPAGHREGDLWFILDEDNAPARFNGTSWVAALLGDNAISYLDAGTITAGFLAAERLQAKSLTTEKLVVGGLSDSQILNGGFEELRAGSTNHPANWDGRNGTAVCSTSTVRSGLRTLLCTADASGYGGVISQDYYPVAGLEWLAVTGWHQGAGTASLAIHWYASNKVFLSGQDIGTAPNAAGYARMAVNIQAPSTARYYQLIVRVQGASGTVGRWDDVDVKKLIGGAHILAASINDAHIESLTVTNAMIQNLDAGKLTAATVNANLFTGTNARFASSTATSRVELFSGGIRAVNASNQIVFSLDAGGGGGFFTGAVATRGSSHRIEINTGAGSQLVAYIDGILNPGWLRMLRFDGSGAAYAGGTPYGRPGIEIAPPSRSSRRPTITLGAPADNGGPEDHTTIFLNADRVISTTTEGFAFRRPGLAGEMRWRYDGVINLFNNQTTTYPFLEMGFGGGGSGGGSPVFGSLRALGSTTGAMLFGTSNEVGWHCKPYGGATTEYSIFRASNLNPSGADSKIDTLDADPLTLAPETILATLKPITYRYKRSRSPEEQAAEKTWLGFRAEDLPALITSEDPENGVLCVDPLGLTAYAWQVLQQVMLRVLDVEADLQPIADGGQALQDQIDVVKSRATNLEQRATLVEERAQLLEDADVALQSRDQNFESRIQRLESELQIA